MLKVIATMLMVIDHIGSYFEEIPFAFALRIVGRSSYPLFLFCMVWGYHYTKSRKLFLLRLYLMSLLMGLMMYLIEYHFFPDAVIGYGYHNIFQSMLLVGVLISIIETYLQDKKKASWMLIGFLVSQLSFYILPKYIPILRHLSGDHLSAVFPSLRINEYGIEFVALGVLMYFLKEKKDLFSVMYLLFCIAQFTDDMDHGIPMQSYMVFALPLMLRYNKEKGHGAKYFFYLFYPAHTFILFYLANRLAA